MFTIFCTLTEPMDIRIQQNLEVPSNPWVFSGTSLYSMEYQKRSKHPAATPGHFFLNCINDL